MIRADRLEPEGSPPVWVLCKVGYDSYDVLAAFHSQEQALMWKAILDTENPDELRVYVDELPFIREGVLPTVYTQWMAFYRGKLADYAGQPSEVRSKRVIREMDILDDEEIQPGRIRVEYDYSQERGGPLAGMTLVTADGTDREAVIACLHKRVLELQKERGLERGEAAGAAESAS